MPKAFDASAVVALLRDERGATEAANHLVGGLVSAVNYAEVITVLLRRGMPPEAAEQLWDALGLELVPFDRAQARLAALLYPTLQRFGLSLGDRACLALAASRRAGVVTAERVWADLAVPDLEILVIR